MPSLSLAAPVSAICSPFLADPTKGLLPLNPQPSFKLNPCLFYLSIIQILIGFHSWLFPSFAFLKHIKLPQPWSVALGVSSREDFERAASHPDPLLVTCHPRPWKRHIKASLMRMSVLFSKSLRFRAYPGIAERSEHTLPPLVHLPLTSSADFWCSDAVTKGERDSQLGQEPDLMMGFHLTLLPDSQTLEINPRQASLILGNCPRMQKRDSMYIFI